MPSGPPPKMKPDRATSSTASARSATTAMAYIIFMRHEYHVTDHTLPRLGDARAPQARQILLGLGPSLALEARAYRRRFLRAMRSSTLTNGTIAQGVLAPATPTAAGSDARERRRRALPLVSRHRHTDR